mmetsp:Transcript_9318/g.21129  ORF Transcript_9318/g.21129 Transcript_9318/m.21129 type:complete len:368 (+) Transcript_9318:224-1327(+)
MSLRGPPGSSSGSVSSVSRRPIQNPLLCNKCAKPLNTTCFLCACDCVFCEECTYSHFEHSSQCPTCNRRLGENDFTELVVATQTTDIQKTSMQALFSRKSSSGNLPFSDLCQTLIHQIDVSKQSTKFLLKQFLIESHRNGSRTMAASRAHESLKAENTHLKQKVHSQQLQYEQTIGDLQNKLRAKEQTIAENNRMIMQFRQLHGGGGPGRGGPIAGARGAMAVPPHAHNVPASSASSLSSRSAEPPLRGLMAKRDEVNRQRQQTMNGARRSFMPSGIGGHGGKSPGSNNPNFRPFSSSSIGSGSLNSSTPRIRDLSASSGYHFSGHLSNQGGQPLNKRRRTPNGSFGPGGHTSSPNTQFARQHGRYH